MSIIQEDEAKQFPDLYRFEIRCIDFLRGMRDLMKRAGGCSGNMRVRSGVLCLFEDQKKKALLRKIIE